MKFNVLHILDIIPVTCEFKWLVLESLYALDSANAIFQKIGKRLK